MVQSQQHNDDYAHRVVRGECSIRRTVHVKHWIRFLPTKMDWNAAVSDGHCRHAHHFAAGRHILHTHANHIRCETLDERTEFQATWLEIHMGFGIGSHQFLQFYHIRCILVTIRYRHIISHHSRCHKTFILRNRMDWLRQIVFP